jgi:hypothetical protein
MKRLQESLLLLTKIDNRMFTGVDDTRIDLAVSDKVHQLQELLHARSLHCKLDLEEASVPANRELLDILLNNLFSNAIRHNVAAGEIHARLDQHSLGVSNTGTADHQANLRYHGDEGAVCLCRGLAFIYDLVLGKCFLWKCREIGIDAAAFRGAVEEKFASLAEAGFGGAVFVHTFCDQTIGYFCGFLTEPYWLMPIRAGVISFVQHILLFSAPVLKFCARVATLAKPKK